MTPSIRIAIVVSGVNTLQRLSQLTQIEYTRLSRIANGHKRPSATERDAIATVLGAPSEHVLDAACIGTGAG